MLAAYLKDAVEDAISKGKVAKSEIAKVMRTVDLVEKDPPNSEWMINALSVFDPKHKLFYSKYVPPMKESSEKMGLRTGLAVDNKDGFFMNMPKLSEKEMQSRALPLPKSVTIAQKIMLMERR